MSHSLALRAFVFVLLIGSMLGINFVQELFAAHKSRRQISEPVLVFQ